VLSTCAAVISGPSSASAAVAAAIRAVRDEGLTRTPSASSDGGESTGRGDDEVCEGYVLLASKASVLIDLALDCCSLQALPWVYNIADKSCALL
jgi:hypothetical protein